MLCNLILDDLHRSTLMTMGDGFLPFTPSSPLTNKGKFYITSLAHLPISYMIQCSRCKVQYIGETKRQLSDRFGEHRRAIEKAITHRHIDQPTAVSDHFTLPGHSINDIELIPLELIHSNRESIRKAREAFLISKGKTLEPHGINRRDET